MPKIVYEGRKIESIGHEQFIYDSNGRLTAMRQERFDTIPHSNISGNNNSQLEIHSLTKSSVVWDNGRVIGIVRDSVLFESYLDGFPYQYSLQQNIEAYNYIYSESRLHSIVYLEEQRVEVFTSDASGRIDTIRTTSLQNFGPDINGLQVLVETITAYDDKPNPFYQIFQEYGFPLPQFRFSFTRNNPVSSEIKWINGPNEDLTLNLEWEYIYNDQGYPETIITNPNSDFPELVEIEYY